MKRFVMRNLVTALMVSGVIGASSQSLASAFQLWEQDGASIANYHAGYAALAADASTAWYNPAGITRFKNQQIVLGAAGIMSDFKYKGSVSVTESVPQVVPISVFPFRRLVVTPATVTFPGVTAQGGAYSTVPDFHYVAPLTDRIGFGFSITVPFGLKTDYGRSTPLRYSATLTSISVVDISPSIAFQVTDKTSFGLGFDVQRVSAEFDSIAVLLTPVPSPTSAFPPPFTTSIVPGLTGSSTNRANGTGYGYHLGLMHEFTEDTRAGISYHSQVAHHLTGSSKFEGGIANQYNGGPFSTGRASANLTLPAYTALSGYHRLNPKWAVMGSAIYTQWDVFNQLVLKNVAGAVGIPTSPFVQTVSNLEITIPQHYRNTWNFTVGADYEATDKIRLRGGVGYDQTPIKNKYRTVQLPDNNRFVIALGGHFQATKTVGYDLGWSHFFFNQARVTPPPQTFGGETINVSGNVTGGADVFGAQITWDIV